MNKDLKNGLIVSGIAVVVYLIYKQVTKPKDILQSAVVDPVKIGLPVESPNKPVEEVVISAPLSF